MLWVRITSSVHKEGLILDSVNSIIQIPLNQNNNQASSHYMRSSTWVKWCQCPTVNHKIPTSQTENQKDHNSQSPITTETTQKQKKRTKLPTSYSIKASDFRHPHQTKPTKSHILITQNPKDSISLLTANNKMHQKHINENRTSHPRFN